MQPLTIDIIWALLVAVGSVLFIYKVYKNRTRKITVWPMETLLEAYLRDHGINARIVEVRSEGKIYLYVNGGVKVFDKWRPLVDYILTDLTQKPANHANKTRRTRQNHNR